MSDMFENTEMSREERIKQLGNYQSLDDSFMKRITNCLSEPKEINLEEEVVEEDKNKIYYVYVYCDTTSKYGCYSCGVPGGFDLLCQGEPFYVGKGKNRRYIDHMSEAKNVTRKPENKNKCDRIRNILLQGQIPQIIRSGKLTEREAYTLEQNMIRTIGRKDLNRGSLLNMNNGNGVPSEMIYTKETRDKMSAAKKNYVPWNKGKTGIYSLETLEQMSKSRKGKKFGPRHRTYKSSPWNKDLKKE